VPGSTLADDPILVPVKPQLLDRRAEDAVYCSCRCDGPDPNASYCECPDGFSCVELIKLGGAGQLAGSYCVKEGTIYTTPPGGGTGPACNVNTDPLNCGPIE
jgi:hypothetical protein